MEEINHVSSVFVVQGFRYLQCFAFLDLFDDQLMLQDRLDL